MFGDYPKYEIRKKDITDKFHKRVAEIYPSDTYNITKDWLSSAIAHLEFLPEYAERLDEFPSTSEFRIAIKQSNFDKLVHYIASNIEQYFDIQIEYNIMLDTNVRKIILCFYNQFIPEGQQIVFFIEYGSSTTPIGILIPPTEMKYKHDYLAYDGNVYSVIDTYQDYMNDAIHSRTKTDDSVGYQDSSVDVSLTLYEIVHYIRNGISIFMSYVEMEECVEIILASRNIYMTKNSKKEKKSLVFDKFISPMVKLDFYIKIWVPTSEIGHKVFECPCSRCNVVIESGEMVCTTKCCRRTMHLAAC